MSRASGVARPTPGARLASVADIPDGGAIVVDGEGPDGAYSLILARRGPAVWAFDNVCPHAGWPLEAPDGRVLMSEGAFLVCAGHGASFRHTDGGYVAGPTSPCQAGLTPAPVDIIDGVVRAGGSLDADAGPT